MYYIVRDRAMYVINCAEGNKNFIMQSVCVPVIKLRFDRHLRDFPIMF